MSHDTSPTLILLWFWCQPNISISHSQRPNVERRAYHPFKGSNFQYIKLFEWLCENCSNCMGPIKLSLSRDINLRIKFWSTIYHNFIFRSSFTMLRILASFIPLIAVTERPVLSSFLIYFLPKRNFWANRLTV